MDAFVLACDRSSTGTHQLVLTAELHGKSAGRVVMDDDSDCKNRLHDSDGLDDRFHLTTRSFALAPGQPGMLVQSENGGEAIHRHYWLVGMVGNEPALLWQTQYGTNEAVSIENSRLVVRRSPDGRSDELEHTAPYPYTSQCDERSTPAEVAQLVADGAGDRWRHVRIAFDPAAGRMKSLSVKEYGVTLGSFADTGAAIALKCRLAKKPGCHAGEFLVLRVGDDTAPWTVSAGKEVVLTAIVPTAKAAAELARPDAACPERPEARVGLLLDGPRPLEGER